jgi:2-C-methyl-D-erythritol 4-phosphate cytidylyltransferase
MKRQSRVGWYYWQMPKNYVLIPAAGAGSRMGAELPKQYLPLLGKPLIHHTLSAFCAHPAVAQVVVVLSPDDRWWDGYDWRDFAGRVSVLRCGGATRAATVLGGLQGLDLDEDDWVLVHDAVRPCITTELLDRLFAELQDDETGGLLAVPLADTLKRAGADGRVANTEPRDDLWQAQTPQMFRYGLLRRALQALGTDTPTDEAQAVEYLGLSPKLVPGDVRNLKVTFPRDLALAEMILKGEKC